MAQTYANHARWFPIFHFVASPILHLHVLFTGWLLYREPSFRALWALLIAVGLVALLYSCRMMALKVQDRLIRLEETLRLTRLLPPDLQGAVGTLRARHLVALRFAPDDEVADLVRRVVAGELDSQDAIKRAIRTWRPDTFRA